MTFNSWDFIASFLIFLPIYFSLRILAWQNAALLLYSWAFYAYGNWRLWFLLFGYSAVAWLIGLMIAREAAPKGKMVWLVVGITAAITTLSVFKYFDFAVDTTNELARWAGLPINLGRLGLALPFGISFYTFQCIAYLVDVYRGEFPAERSFFKFALFKAFFPQLVAGPIERAHNLMPQLAKKRTVRFADVNAGIMLISIGYLLKVVVADTLSPIVNLAIDGVDVGPISGPTVLLGVGSFGLQIYGDFAGYSMIAVGLARILGIRLTMNFNAPYFAWSPSDFWHRWHITLSTWLRDYLYVPLGGNRGGPSRTVFNLLLTMALGGLWHGAAWTFILWGTYHGLLLVGARAVNWIESPASIWQRVPLIIITFIFVHIGWLIFRVHDIGHLGRAVDAILFDWRSDEFTFAVARAYIPLLIIVFVEHIFTLSGLSTKPLPAAAERTIFAGVLAGVILLTVGFRYAPFIYFRF